MSETTSTLHSGRHTDPKHDARLEDCRWMADTGETLTGAASRLHITRNGLDKWLRKHDPVTLTALLRNEPHDDAQRARNEARWAS